MYHSGSYNFVLCHNFNCTNVQKTKLEGLAFDCIGITRWICKHRLCDCVDGENLQDWHIQISMTGPWFIVIVGLMQRGGRVQCEMLR